MFKIRVPFKDINNIYRKKMEKIFIVLTYRCNLKCNMCDVWMAKTDELPTFFINEFLNKLKARGIKEIIFTGGEPLVRNDFFDIAKEAHKLRFHVSLCTNGSLINEGVAKSIAKYINAVTISFEGNRECHDNIRGKGTFDLVIQAIRLLRKYRIFINLNMVVSKVSYMYMKDIVDLATDLRVDAVSFKPFSKNLLKNRKDNCNRYILDNKNIYDLQNSIEAVIKYADFKNQKLLTQETMRLIPEHFRLGNELKPKEGCFLPLFSAVILPDGSVTPCIGSDLKIGNLMEESIDLIWNSNQFEEERKKALEKKCNGCSCSLIENEFYLKKYSKT